MPVYINLDDVIAIGRYLDDHAHMEAVVVPDAIAELRRCGVDAPDDEVQVLLVEMAASRQLAVRFGPLPDITAPV